MDILDQEVRLLTIKNPYAELFLHGKTIETRTRMTYYRGLVLIHAGKVEFPWDDVKNIAGDQHFERILERYAIKALGNSKPGEALALARLIDSRPMNKADESKAFVAHNYSLYSWVFEDIMPIVPFAIRGSQGMNRVLEQKKLIQIK